MMMISVVQCSSSRPLAARSARNAGKKCKDLMKRVFPGGGDNGFSFSLGGNSAHILQDIKDKHADSVQMLRTKSEEDMTFAVSIVEESLENALEAILDMADRTTGVMDGVVVRDDGVEVVDEVEGVEEDDDAFFEKERKE